MALKATDDVNAIGHCEFCDHQWSMSGPALEVAKFLRAKMIEHLHEVHPDKVAEVEAEWAAEEARKTPES